MTETLPGGAVSTPVSRIPLANQLAGLEEMLKDMSPATDWQSLARLATKFSASVTRPNACGEFEYSRRILLLMASTSSAAADYVWPTGGSEGGRSTDIELAVLLSSLDVQESRIATWELLWRARQNCQDIQNWETNFTGTPLLGTTLCMLCIHLRGVYKKFPPIS